MEQGIHMGMNNCSSTCGVTLACNARVSYLFVLFNFVLCRCMPYVARQSFGIEEMQFDKCSLQTGWSRSLESVSSEFCLVFLYLCLCSYFVVLTPWSFRIRACPIASWVSRCWLIRSWYEDHRRGLCCSRRVCVCVCGCVCVAVGQAWYGELLSQIVYVSRLVCRGKSGLDVLRMSRN